MTNTTAPGSSEAAAMRRASAELLARGDRLRIVMSRLDYQVAGMAYAGPSAERFRSSIAEQRRQLGLVYGHFTQAAETLNRMATDAEASGYGRIG